MSANKIESNLNNTFQSFFIFDRLFSTCIHFYILFFTLYQRRIGNEKVREGNQ